MEQRGRQLQVVFGDTWRPCIFSCIVLSQMDKRNITLKILKKYCKQRDDVSGVDQPRQYHERLSYVYLFVYCYASYTGEQMDKNRTGKNGMQSRSCEQLCNG